MKTRLILIATALIFIVSSLAVSAQNGNFSGEWKLNTQKTVLPSDQLYLLKVTVKQEGNNLLTTRVYSNSNGEEYPFEENLTLDGKECKITIYDMPRVSKATKAADGSLALESVTTFNANGSLENLVANEVWKLDKETLTIDVTNKMMGNEIKGVTYYDKVK